MIGRLRRALGEDRVVTDPDVLAAHGRDATGRFGAPPVALVRPRDTAEVAVVVALARETGTPLVPQGGNTGLVGGGVPRGREVVVSTARLGPADLVVDADAGTVTAGAGATLAAVQAAASAAGWRYPVDLAARDTATIAGTIATNAGGHHVLAHGMTRHHLRGVEAVLGTGDVISHLRGLVKDNTGFDLAGLLCGSEGSLGIVTAACLGLVPAPAATAVALVGCPDLDAAVRLTAAARLALTDLEAAEVVLADGATLVEAQTGISLALDPVPPVTLLLEVAGATGAGERLARFLAGQDDLGDTALAEDRAGRVALWRVREEQNPAVTRVGPAVKYDVTLPLAGLGEAVAEIRGRVAGLGPDARLWVFGHVGDGNLHLNLTGLDVEDPDLVRRADDAVLGLVAERGGSISAEHGIGVAKRAHLHLARSPAELWAFRAIKAALDPDGILNPGVLV